MTRSPLRRERRATKMGLGRREFLAGVLGGAFASACTGRSEAGPFAPAVVGHPAGAAGSVTGRVSGHAGLARSGRAFELWSWFDLPASDPRSRELSGIAWDEKAGMLWAVQDETPNIVAIRPD